MSLKDLAAGLDDLSRNRETLTMRFSLNF